MSTTQSTPRETFLMGMYTQLCTEINRSITTVWQSVSILVAAFALLALAEKKVVTLDIAIALVNILCIWLVCHVLDASYWYNRNLVMIANIERQFLSPKDLQEIHYYFGAHRPKNRMISHLRLQLWLAIGLGGAITAFHFLSQVFPFLPDTMGKLSLQTALPYVTLAVGAVIAVRLNKSCDDSYAEFVKNSPGREVDITGVSYGVGHGFKASDAPKRLDVGQPGGGKGAKV